MCCAMQELTTDSSVAIQTALFRRSLRTLTLAAIASCGGWRGAFVLKTVPLKIVLGILNPMDGIRSLPPHGLFDTPEGIVPHRETFK